MRGALATLDRANAGIGRGRDPFAPFGTPLNIPLNTDWWTVLKVFEPGARASREESRNVQSWHRAADPGRPINSLLLSVKETIFAHSEAYTL